ncbi:phage portal protein [Actinomadura sp. WMMA1423]|uniref:phage portal protein n=1 Tax=Actinomadura sp. WMMA1423 TaxID=2591108 RepID=UPI0011475101|nr:phage portal protein [Actinomadura sp. WMMA1423]
MSVLFGRGVERRAANLGSFFAASSVIPANSEAGGPVPGGTGIEWSLQKVAVWGCVNLTATIAECMPIEVFSSDAPDKRRLPVPAWLADLGGDGHGLPDWLYQAVLSFMLRGNLYGIVPDGMRDTLRGTPTMIQLQHPDHVSVHQPWNGDPPEWRMNGREVPTRDVWHRRVYPVPGRLLGASPIEYGAGVVSLGVESTQFGLRWFHQGAHPSGLLTTDAHLKPDQAKTAKERFLSALRGGAREPLVLGGGWKFQTIQVAPNESQMLETQGATSAECCRLFGPGYAQIFGYETGESLTYANIEQRSLDLLTYSVDPWLVRLERILTMLLPAGRNVKFNRKGLLRSDLLTRYQAHEIALRNRMGTVNEARAEEDLPPLEGGDELPAEASPAPPPVPVKVQN